MADSSWAAALANVITQIAAALIFMAMLLSGIRLAIGRTLVDRIVAIDMLTVISLSLIALYAHVSGRFVYIDVALVYGLLSFLAVLAIARFLERGL
ncbi:monovalent cation/H+ antiporter complex subunit F [Camelimonas sp. ID_303_24]